MLVVCPDVRMRIRRVSVDDVLEAGKDNGLRVYVGLIFRVVAVEIVVLRSLKKNADHLKTERNGFVVMLFNPIHYEIVSRHTNRLLMQPGVRPIAYCLA